MTIRIVVPCYNEAARLRPEVFAEHAEATGHHFLFVDDGSSDGTADLLREHVTDKPEQLSLFELEHNVGKAEAVRRGMLQALEAHPRFVGFLDADLAAPVSALCDLAAVLEEHPEIEIVFGSRVQLLGRTIARNSLRHYVGRVFATAASLTLALPVYDTQCGAKLFRVNAGTEALFGEPFMTRWLLEIEIIARLSRLRRGDGGAAPIDVIYEQPLREWREIPGSKLSPWDFPRSLLELWRIRRRYMR